MGAKLVFFSAEGGGGINMIHLYDIYACPDPNPWTNADPDPTFDEIQIRSCSLKMRIRNKPEIFKIMGCFSLFLRVAGSTTRLFHEA